jgi:hypothetical protein
MCEYGCGSGTMSVGENAYKWMWVWDRALVKTAYVPLSQRIRSERSSNCGKCG